MRKLKGLNIRAMVERRLVYHARMIEHYESVQSAAMTNIAKIHKAMEDANLHWLASSATLALSKRQQECIDSANAHREALESLRKESDRYGITH